MLLAAGHSSLLNNTLDRPMNENQKNKPNTQSSTDGGNFREVDPIFHSRPEFEQFLPKRYLMPQTENVVEEIQISPRIDIHGAPADKELNESVEPPRTFNPAQITEIISSSTSTIRRLVEANDALKSQAFETISSYKEQLNKEKSYSAHLLH